VRSELRPADDDHELSTDAFGHDERRIDQFAPARLMTLSLARAVVAGTGFEPV